MNQENINEDNQLFTTSVIAKAEANTDTNVNVTTSGTHSVHTGADIALANDSNEEKPSFFKTYKFYLLVFLVIILLGLGFYFIIKKKKAKRYSEFPGY